LRNYLTCRHTSRTSYQVGDRFYMKRKPHTYFIHYADKSRSKRKVSYKLQRRFTGPYTITRRFSPVLYEAIIDGKAQTVHALKMQLDPTSAHYRLHLPEFTPTEPLPRKVQFKAEVDEQGATIVPTLGRKANKRASYTPKRSRGRPRKTPAPGNGQQAPVEPPDEDIPDEDDEADSDDEIPDNEFAYLDDDDGSDYVED
jgi:hypothetical protein